MSNVTPPTFSPLELCALYSAIIKHCASVHRDADPEAHSALAKLDVYVRARIDGMSWKPADASWYLVVNEEDTVLAVYGSSLREEAHAKARELVALATSAPLFRNNPPIVALWLVVGERPHVGQRYRGKYETVQVEEA